MDQMRTAALIYFSVAFLSCRFIFFLNANTKLCRGAKGCLSDTSQSELPHFVQPVRLYKNMTLFLPIWGICVKSFN